MQISQFELLCMAENGAFYDWLHCYETWDKEKTPESLDRVNAARERLEQVRKMIDDHRKGIH